MTGLNILRELHRHMEWADAAVWKAVLAHPRAVSEKKILLWRGEPRETPYPEFAEARPMMAWGKNWFPEASAFPDAVTDEILSAPMPIPWSKMVERRIGRPPGSTSLGDTVLQVAECPPAG